MGRAPNPKTHGAPAGKSRGTCPIPAPRPGRSPARMRTARRRLCGHVLGASRLLVGGDFLWPRPSPPGARGEPGGSGPERAVSRYGSAARYAACLPPGVWSLGEAGETEAARAGPGSGSTRGPGEPGVALDAGAPILSPERLLPRNSFTPEPRPGWLAAVERSRNLTLGVPGVWALKPGDLAALSSPAPNPHAAPPPSQICKMLRAEVSRPV